eukprot:c9819_g1_i2.p1 GENE.c9819_g1_i2~~c9819_g1_i2.p1  ORF type:complete len:209 (-),score=63.92 c9819_g1_i2:14-640(-)
MTLTDTQITSSKHRALYAYGHATVSMDKCIVSHTQSPTHAAVEVNGDCEMNLENCTISHNQGIGLKLVGICVTKFNNNQSNQIQNNCAGDVVLVGPEQLLHLEAQDCVSNAVDDNDDETTTGPLRQQQKQVFVWEFDGGEDKGGWIAYDEMCARRIEAAFAAMLLSPFYLPRPFHQYKVDLMRLQQTNTKTGFVRMVRRRAALVNNVA